MTHTAMIQLLDQDLDHIESLLVVLATDDCHPFTAAEARSLLLRITEARNGYPSLGFPRHSALTHQRTNAQCQLVNQETNGGDPGSTKAGGPLGDSGHAAYITDLPDDPDPGDCHYGTEGKHRA